MCVRIGEGRERKKKEIIEFIYHTFSTPTAFRSYGQRAIEAAKYIGQGFTVTLDHLNRSPITVQYPYEKIVPSERFRGRIHFEFDKCIACEVRVRVCPINLPVVDWKLMKNIKKKQLISHSIDFGVRIFCGNRVEYRPTNCLSMTEEYELSSYDRHESNYDQTALGRLPLSISQDFSVHIVSANDPSNNVKDRYFDNRTVTRSTKEIVKNMD